MATEQRGRVRVEPGAKRVRAYLGGELVADTTRPLLVWEIPYYPAYYLPVDDVVAELVPTGDTATPPAGATAQVLTVRAAACRRGARRRLRYPDEPDRASCATTSASTGRRWTRWFEEDEEVFTHPRSPVRRGSTSCPAPARWS